MDGPVALLAERQHGVVARRQLREQGFDASAIESRLRRGGLLPVHRGVYAVGHRKLTAEGRWIAAVLACGPGAVLSHRSAGQLWAILPRSGSIPEVTRPREFRARRGIHAHRALVPPDEIEEVDRIPVTSVSRTLLDLASMAGSRRSFGPRQLEQALNEAEVRGLTSRLSIPALLARYPRRRGSTLIRGLLEDDEGLHGITKLELEARFAALVDAHDLPKPRRNAQLAVRGRFYEVDCLWQPQRVVVELDGHAVHGTRRAFETDRERDRILLAEGWQPVRVTWWQLRDEPEAIVGDLLRLLDG